MTCDLYRFYDVDNHLLYVGISLHAAQRASEHRGDKSWWSDVARMNIEHLADRTEALEAELTAIRTERPRYNVTGAVRPGTAAERWPDAEWIYGHGPYASVAHCNVTTVLLHPTEEQAQAAKRRIDRGGCGGRCVRQHEIVRV